MLKYRVDLQDESNEAAERLKRYLLERTLEKQFSKQLQVMEKPSYDICIYMSMNQSLISLVSILTRQEQFITRYKSNKKLTDRYCPQLQHRRQVSSAASFVISRRMQIGYRSELIQIIQFLFDSKQNYKSPCGSFNFIVPSTTILGSLYHPMNHSFQAMVTGHYSFEVQIYQQQLLFGKFRSMGANNSQLSTIRPFDKDEWQAVPLIPYTNIKDPLYASNFRVLANKLNATLEIQKYDLYFNTYKEYSSYKEFINWRNTNRFTVQVKYVSEPQRQNMCATYYQGSIYIQRIPIRLVEIEDISIEEGLCILNAASQGFQRLYEKFRYFQIEPEHICFTKEGYVKVWVNKNLSKNLPETIFNENRRENYDFFIERLITVVEGLIEFEGKHSIKVFIELNGIQKPYENLLKTLEEYAKYAKVKVPRYLTTIRNLCQRDLKMKTLAARRRNSVASYQFGSNYRNSISLKTNNNNKSLEIDQEVVNIAIKSPTKNKNSMFIEPFDFTRKQNGYQLSKNTCNTSRALTVRFSYNTSNILNSIPSSERIHKDEQPTITRNGPSNVSNTAQFTGKSHLTERKRQRYQSVLDNTELDPDIAEDIKRLTRY